MALKCSDHVIQQRISPMYHTFRANEGKLTNYFWPGASSLTEAFDGNSVMGSKFTPCVTKNYRYEG